MVDLLSGVAVLFGVVLLFVDTVPGAFWIEPSIIGLGIIALGAWRLARKCGTLKR
ncbi:MAG: hypothetical protein HY290_01975 [Planctomycetia bacterium]|nr:hypothetical protein [Planctomycetia bacterium]